MKTWQQQMWASFRFDYPAGDFGNLLALGTTGGKNIMKYNMIRSLVLTGTIAFALNAQDTVPQREERQQDRVAQGEKSGQLTPGESSKIQGRESHINNEVKKDRAANGGTLTNGEKDKVQHQLNDTSKTIAKDKHNDRTTTPQ
jgi:hypothetical protein